jgi:hypothetical protein
VGVDATEALYRGAWGLMDDTAASGVTFTGPVGLLPSVYDVTGFAAAAVGAAARAVALLVEEAAGGGPVPVTVDRRAASAAFLCERLFTPEGWVLPPVWDPLAGDYRTADGWIRLHTNYSYHRAAVERVLAPAQTRDEVAAAVARWRRVDLESAVVAAGGPAAALTGAEAWKASSPGAAVTAAPAIRVTARPGAGVGRTGFDPQRPLAGIRVLDLTRVIAGPVATRFLAAYGADVLRVDPPGFQEVPALLPEMTAGKRCAALNLREPADRAVFEQLVGQADVLVCGLRNGALDALGYSAEALYPLNPGLIDARLNAYGWSGPWAGRRGFDSLVQMSCGIAAAGAEAAGQDEPLPLPAQALDHGTGFLVAAAIVNALRRRMSTGESCSIAASLAGTATLLMHAAVPAGLTTAPVHWTNSDTHAVETAWGPGRSVPLPARIDGIPAELPVAAGPVGRHPASWLV